MQQLSESLSPCPRPPLPALPSRGVVLTKLVRSWIYVLQPHQEDPDGQPRWGVIFRSSYGGDPSGPQVNQRCFLDSFVGLLAYMKSITAAGWRRERGDAAAGPVHAGG